MENPVENNQPAESKADLKLDLQQFARSEMHVAKEDIRELLRADVKDAKDEIKKQNWTAIKIGLAILSIIGVGNFLSLRHVVDKEVQIVRENVKQRLTEEFATPRIQTLIGEKAKEYTETSAKKYIAEIVDKSIQPYSDELHSKFGDLKKETSSFKSYLENTKTRFDKEYKTLEVEVNMLKQTNKLINLGADAVAHGNRKALEELNVYFINNPEGALNTIAHAEIYRVKAFYVGTSRIKGFSITHNDVDGTKKKDTEIATPQLLLTLKRQIQGSENWQYRAKAAELLSTRKDKEIPDVLLESCKKDEILDVVKTSLESFAAITGYSSVDIFGCDEAKEWWKEHESEVKAKLK